MCCIVLLLCSALLGQISAILVEKEWRIYYDLRTNQTIDTVDGTNPRFKLYKRPQQQNKILRIGFGPIPCSCQGLTCGCCAGMDIQTLSFNRRACMNFTYDPQEFAIDMDMFMNDELMFSNSVSAKNPPPLCMPVPIPPVLPTLDFCVKMFNIHTPGYNIFMCMDFLTRLERAPVLVLHFDCMELGVDGISYHKPDEAEIEAAEGGPGDLEDGIFDEVMEEGEEVANTTATQPNKSLLTGDQKKSVGGVAVKEEFDEIEEEEEILDGDRSREKEREDYGEVVDSDNEKKTIVEVTEEKGRDKVNAEEYLATTTKTTPALIRFGIFRQVYQRNTKMERKRQNVSSYRGE